MEDSLDGRLAEIFRLGKLFAEAGESYQAAKLQQAGAPPLDEATAHYRAAGIDYLQALEECEQYLLSVHWKLEVSEELEHVRTFKKAAEVVLDNL